MTGPSVPSGYSLPLSPGGKASLVTRPPWFFGGDAVELAYLADARLVQSFLPWPFQPSAHLGLISITMVDMTSLSCYEEAFDNPERTQYRECLIKIHCQIGDKTGWYVPMTWVDKDFSLLRGFIQGFGKRLGSIHMTKFHDLNPLIGGKRPGAKIRAICESFNGIHIDVGLELNEQTSSDVFVGLSPEGTSMFVTRHFPDIENPANLTVHEVSELVVTGARKDDIWLGSGELRLYGNASEDVLSLQPLRVLGARCFREGFELRGGRVIYRYEN